MFDFGQIPTWLRRATWDWKIVRRMRSKKSLSKLPSRVPVLGLADWLKESLGEEVVQADDRRFVFPYSNDAVSSALFAFFITALFSLVFLYLVFISYDGIMYDLSVNEASWHSLSVSFLLLAVQVLCFFVFSYSFLIAFSAIFRVIRRLFGNYPRLSLVFDRERGVVFLPPIGLGGYDEVPWESLVVVNFHMPKMYGGAFKVIKAFRPSDLRLITLNEDFPDEAMAFYSWYMDRSKPLPPDEVFDPYRERDEERRLREYGPEVVRQFPASLTGPGTRLVTRMGMAGFR